MSLSSILTLIIGGILINNVVLTKFLGMCPFMGVSTKLSSAIGMGLAVTFVIFGSSVLSWLLYYYVLDPLNIEYMELITFILLIAAFVQFVETKRSEWKGTSIVYNTERIFKSQVNG